MNRLIAIALGALMLFGCAAEKRADAPVAEVPAAAVPTATATVAPTQTQPAVEATATGTIAEETSTNAPDKWAGQIKVGQPISMFNYVGSESGDFAPMRFRNDSEAGKKILAVCANDDLCEFTGIVEWLDEPPPADASAIGQIVRVDSVRRLPPEQ